MTIDRLCHDETAINAARMMQPAAPNYSYRSMSAATRLLRTVERHSPGPMVKHQSSASSLR